MESKRGESGRPRYGQRHSQSVRLPDDFFTHIAKGAERAGISRNNYIAWKLYQAEGLEDQMPEYLRREIPTERSNWEGRMAG